MGDTAASGAGGQQRRRWRRLGKAFEKLRGGRARTGRCRAAAAAATMIMGLLLSACTSDYDWRDTRAAGGEYWVQLPARPAAMTRRIHLERFEVDMTMQGAKAKDNAFTVAMVPLPAQAAEAAGLTPERILAAMREQMLRNIGAPSDVPSQPAVVAVVGADGRKSGTAQWESVAARGTGRHAALELRGRFGVWRGHALQIVAVGPDLDPEQASYFLDSLRLVER